MTAGSCPSCGQPLTADVPVIDVLRIAHTMSCTLESAEDATRAADYDRLVPGFTFTRPVTPTEMTLLTSLTALGYMDASTGEPPALGDRHPDRPRLPGRTSARLA